MSIGLSRTIASPRPFGRKAQSLVRASRNAGEHETPAMSADVAAAVAKATADVGADIEDPNKTFNLSIYESFDGGQTWHFACGNTDVGRAGRMDMPFIQLADPAIGGRMVKAVVTLGQSASAGCILEVA